ncbi:porphobilinogen synthase, partial [bacterium]|nr:porphobilinogen synthase [bacterium]
MQNKSKYAEHLMLDLVHRPRRNRKNEVFRGFARETSLSADRFILPLFIHELATDHSIASMPGCSRLSPESLLREAEGAIKDGVKAIVLFPALPESQKSSKGEAAYDSKGLVPRS